MDCTTVCSDAERGMKLVKLETQWSFHVMFHADSVHELMMSAVSLSFAFFYIACICIDISAGVLI